MYGERFRNNMTEKMLIEANFVDAFVYEEIALCISRANQCAEAIVKLPERAASGEPVVHGANKNMDDLVDYWISRLRIASNLLAIDEFRGIMRKHTVHRIVDRKLGII